MEWQIKKILIGLDLDHDSKLKTLHKAIKMAEYSHAKLTVLYACPDYLANPMLGIFLTDEILEKAQTQYQTQLEDLCKANIPKSVEWETAIGSCKGHKPYLCLTEKAKAENFDLIVVGEHDRHGFDHIWLGSNAEKIMRYAPCTVMVVKNKETED
ncbi:MAG: universal stress protein [SAR324 cluster bacterium]|nr:universal stress protein [SAR324 cluster bacterium]